MSLASADMKREIHAKPEYGRKYVRYLKNVLRKDGNDGSYFALEKTIDNMIVYYDVSLGLNPTQDLLRLTIYTLAAPP